MRRKLHRAGMTSRAIRDLRQSQVSQSLCKKGLMELQERQEYFPKGSKKRVAFGLSEMIDFLSSPGCL